MSIPRWRRNLRIGLGVILAFALLFFGSTVALYAALKTRTITMLEIAPTLMKIDVLQHQAQATFSTQEGRFKIASKFVRQGIFSPMYPEAGLIMLDDLASEGHAPSQTLLADILLKYYAPTPENKAKATAYYQSASDQGFMPARDKLAALQKLAQK